MYQFKFTERVEDWWVSEGKPRAYKDLEAAAADFLSVYRSMFEAIEVSAENIRVYLSELDIEELNNFSSNGDLTAGIFLEICKEDKQLLTVFLKYDPLNDLFDKDLSPEINTKCLNEGEKNVIEHLYKNLE